MAEKPAEPVHEIQKFNVTIDEQIEYIESRLKENNQLSFIELISSVVEKLRIVVTFIAMLELVKAGRIGLRESNNFNDFIIYGLSNG